ncbi:MAG: thioredoxin family protein [Epsilonproteobacteria bacterium]|nr:thioredoxin family protein [Campylobacterota bacterium]
MKKLVLTVLLVVCSFGFDWAGKVRWAMSYDSAKQLAIQTHKPIFVDLALSNCPPCRWISQNIYTDDKIADFINKNFIAVLIMVDQEKIPTEVAQFFSGYTPSLIIMDPKKGVQIMQFSFDREFLQNKYKFIDYLKKGLNK